MSIRSSIIGVEERIPTMVIFLMLLSLPLLFGNAMNDTCRGWDLRQPVAYYPGQAPGETICTTWIRGRDITRKWVKEMKEFRSEVFGRKARGRWRTMWMDWAAAGCGQPQPIRYTNQRNPRQEQVRDSAFPRYIITEEGQYLIVDAPPEADETMRLEDKASEDVKPAEEIDATAQDIEHGDEVQMEEQLQAADEKPLSLRDRIDLLLGWRGPPSWRFA
jgi:hypothetical protein